MDPHAEDVHVVDIAHALSMMARFGGHVSRFYCPTPDARILTADLKWTPAGDLRVNDELLAFDETPHELGGAGKRRRRFRQSRVTTATRVKRRIIRLEMADGASIASSEEHPWLVATKQSRNQIWRTAAEVAADLRAGRRRYMHRFVEPWSYAASRDAGWLSGMYDGEGTLGLRGRHGSQLAVSQRPGPVLQELERIHKEMGFDYGISPTGDSDVLSIRMRDGWRGILRLLGSVRPIRLLNNFKAALVGGDFSKQLDGQGTPSEIVAAYDEGEGWVAGLETTTRTYLCEGYGAHNSVAQHSVLVAEQQEQPCDQLAGLFHDAAEAYLVDLPSPIKRQAEFSQLRGIEHAIEFAIGKAIGLDQLVIHKPSIKEADLVLLATEARDFMNVGPNHSGLSWLEKEPLPDPIMPWAPTLARENFLRLYARLTEVDGVCGLCHGLCNVTAGPKAFDPYRMVSSPCEGCGGSGKIAV